MIFKLFVTGYLKSPKNVMHKNKNKLQFSGYIIFFLAFTQKMMIFWFRLCWGMFVLQVDIIDSVLLYNPLQSYTVTLTVRKCCVVFSTHLFFITLFCIIENFFY